MPTFKHSGAIGDVVYSLPTVRALGGGVIYVPTGKPSHFWNQFYGDPIPAMRRLLERQAYVEGVMPYEGQNVDYNLDDFRRFFNLHCFMDSVTLCDMHLMTFGLPISERDHPWIAVDPLPLPAGKKVIICRSSRYHSAFFRWQRIWEEYGTRAVFCGLTVEHQEFEEQVGKIDYLATSDLYELAQYLGGCDLFVGNQSSPCAIAEGLKVSLLQEVCPDCPNCVFSRPKATYRTVY